MKTAANILGLIFLWGCIVGGGKAQESLSDNEIDQAFAASENSLAALLAGSQQQEKEPAQRRMSLEDFFLNRNAQQQEAAPAALQQLPEAQLQVQQPNPDSVLIQRDTNLPVVNGGMLSRLLLARRVLRLRRMIRRMLILPRILRLGRPLRPLRQVAAASPLRLFSNRIGQVYDDPYDPRDYVFGNKGYFDTNLAPSQDTSYNKNKQKQSFRNYDHIVDPYELPYDQINLENEKAVNNYEIDEGKYQYRNKQKQTPNDIDTYGNNQAYDIQKIQEQLQLLQKLQQQNQQLSNYQENDKHANYKSSQKNQPLDSQIYEDSPQVEYESNHEEYDNPTDNKYDSQANQQALEKPNNYKQSSHAKEVDEQQLQLAREQILQLLREQQLQILRDEQLKLQQLQQLQLLQQQQGQGYSQPQNYDNQHSNAESEDQGHNYQEQPYDHQKQNVDEQQQHTNDHATEDGEYEKSQTVGSNAKSHQPGGKAIGVGVNVAIKPPAVDIQVTKPVSPIIKPIPPIVNPIIHKPVASTPVQETLVPIGFLPKPILKLNGRLFFGAEAGKGVTIG
ncbi:probable basic-leucine zipper transcription factor S [Argiope bruennichi]|uniref:Uncharacterized protein n=1 Tax=Argiope bruennichi TaxID=94029 RepID=A0A8T0FYJ9_ARGBR|nr:probable basic-leucine zipper transcription factor S [Argiope bruennichi]KAF8796187.1 hypothetical protein HNY73_000599 [Argiope bruennichi]